MSVPLSVLSLVSLSFFPSVPLLVFPSVRQLARNSDGQCANKDYHMDGLLALSDLALGLALDPDGPTVGAVNAESPKRTF